MQNNSRVLFEQFVQPTNDLVNATHRFPGLSSNIIAPLAYQQTLQVTGVDAAKFLQGQVTCDVLKLAQTEWCLGAHCDPKGRILFNFRLRKDPESFYLTLPAEQMPFALAQLKKYAIFSKVTFTVLEAEHWGHLGLSGPQAGDILAGYIASLPRMQPNTVHVVNGLGIECLPGEYPRFQISGEPVALSSLWQQLSLKAQPVVASHWQLLDILAGMPQILSACQGMFTPHDINYDLLGGVSLNKGCYIGQEIVARMHYLGKLKQRLYLVSGQVGPSLPVPGEKVYQIAATGHCNAENAAAQDSGGSVGTLLNVALATASKYYALASLNSAAITQSLQVANSSTLLEVENSFISA